MRIIKESLVKIKKQGLNILLIAYWFMLIYIVAGFAWWFISLEQQNKQMYQFRYAELKRDEPYFVEKVEALQDARRRKTLQYIGEGGTFFLVILIGAFFVYRAARRALRLSQQQQNFMMAVTHELKTPIAVVRLNLETLLRRQLELAQQKRLLNNTLEEANRLNTLTNNILTVSQLETGAYHLNMQELNISELGENCVHAFQKRFSHRIVETHIEEDIFVKGEYQLLEMLLNNLLDNARKYSAEKTLISFSITQSERNVHIEVADEGNGIPDTEKKNIFNKFYRVGNEDTRSSKGTGLGLYLCNKIVEDHKGRIFIKDNEPIGAIFVVLIPKV